MTRHRSTTPPALWVPGLAVAVGAAVATAHGLYEVAVAAGVPAGIAWLYPLITDGLALVAYAATPRLAGTARTYAWVIVALAAGVSGLAQAVYLAGGVPTPTGGLSGELPAAVATDAAAGDGAAPAPVRFGVGAWPAVAAAVAAHLLFLLTDRHPPETTDATGWPAQAERAHGAEQLAVDTCASTPAPGREPAPSVDVVEAPALLGGAEQASPAAPDRWAAGPELDAAPRLDVGHRLDTAPRLDGLDGLDAAPLPGLDAPAALDIAPAAQTPTADLPSTAGQGPDGEPPAARAREAARTHHARHGSWPTARQLAALADVSRGTAATALKDLRTVAPALHIVPTDTPAERSR